MRAFTLDLFESSFKYLKYVIYLTHMIFMTHMIYLIFLFIIIFKFTILFNFIEKSIPNDFIDFFEFLIKNHFTILSNYFNLFFL